MRRAITLAALAATALATLQGPAIAHFPKPTPAGWNAWATEQVSLGGQRCCNESDSYLYTGMYRYEKMAGQVYGVTIILNDEERFIPLSQFVKVNPDNRNPTGHPVIWHAADYGHVYCWDFPDTLY